MALIVPVAAPAILSFSRSAGMALISSLCLCVCAYERKCMKMNENIRIIRMPNRRPQPGWIRMDSASLSQPGMDSAETLKNTIGVRCQKKSKEVKEVKEVKRSKFKSV